MADNVNATHLDDNTVDVPTDGPAQMEDTGQKRSKAQKRRVILLFLFDRFFVKITVSYNIIQLIYYIYLYFSTM